MTTGEQVAAVRELDALHVIACGFNTRTAWTEYWWRRFELAVLFGIEIGEHWPEGVERPRPAGHSQDT